MKMAKILLNLVACLVAICGVGSNTKVQALDCIDYGDYIHWEGNLSFAPPLRFVTATGDRAYIGNGYFYIAIVDYSNPASPTIVYETLEFGLPADMVLADNYAYAIYSVGGINVFDISNPYRLELVGHVDIPGNDSHTIAQSEGYAYVAGDAGLHVVNIRFPASPELVGGNSDIVTIRNYERRQI